jgi:redox-sensitive bicupin YhaK (pirin superfamily)
MKAGDFQRISAGQGITHSEVNDSKLEKVHFLQIWIMTDVKNAKPDYAEKSFADIATGKLHLVASKTGRDGSISINQDADLYVAKLNPGDRLTHATTSNRHAWLQVIAGELEVGGLKLEAGDAAALAKVDSVSIAATQKAHFLLFDLE